MLLRLGSGTEELRASRSSSGRAPHVDAPRSKSEQLHDRHRFAATLVSFRSPPSNVAAVKGFQLPGLTPLARFL